jgi:hypothetical protein
MLDEIARRLKFNYSIRIAADAAYGKEDETGRWSGIIGELSRRVNFYSKKKTFFFLQLSLDSRFGYWSFNNNISTRTNYRFYKTIYDFWLKNF